MVTYLVRTTSIRIYFTSWTRCSRSASAPCCNNKNRKGASSKKTHNGKGKYRKGRLSAQTITEGPSKIQRTSPPAGERTDTAMPGASGTAVIEMLEVVFAVSEGVGLILEVVEGIVIEIEGEPLDGSSTDGLWGG